MYEGKKRWVQNEVCERGSRIEKLISQLQTLSNLLSLHIRGSTYLRTTVWTRSAITGSILHIVEKRMSSETIRVVYFLTKTIEDWGPSRSLRGDNGAREI